MKLALAAFAFIVTYGLLVTVSRYKPKQAERELIINVSPNSYCGADWSVAQGELVEPGCAARVQKVL